MDNNNNNSHSRGQFMSHFDAIYLVSVDENKKKALLDRFCDLIDPKSEKVNIVGFPASSVKPSLYNRVVSDWKIPQQNYAPIIGCFLSHYKVVEDAKFNRYKTILVLEDTADYGILGTSGSPGTLSKDNWLAEFEESFRQLPSDWDFFYLMAMSFEETKAREVPNAPKLLIGSDFLTTKAYCLSSRVYDKLLAALRQWLEGDNIWPVDHVFGNVGQRTNAYVPKKALCYKIATTSSITGETGGAWFPQVTVKY